MPSFAPRNEPIRKQEILEKREDELYHQLKNDSVEEKIIQAAEKVREAQLNLLKAQKHLNQSYCIEDENPQKQSLRKNIDTQTALWKQYSVKEILDLYKRKLK